MKICIVSDDYPSIGRPVYTFVEQLVHSILELGVQVVVIAPQSISHSIIRRERMLEKCEERVTDAGNSYKVYRPYYVSIGNHQGVVGNTFRYLKSIGVKRVLDSEQPDVLYAHFWHNATLMDDYAEQHSKPLFIACGEGDNALENLVARMSSQRKLQFVSRVKGVICVSSENKRKCLALGLCREDNVTVLPNCVDTDKFRFSASLSVRAQLGITSEDFVIAFCGDFVDRKGSNRLSAAIDALNDPHLKSIFVGRPLAGDDQTPTCQGIAFMGRVEHAELPAYLNSADVFVLPTRKEGCCNAIVEALACGLPVISSEGAFNDDILDERNSLRINPEDVDEIAAAIKRLKGDVKLRNKMRDYSIAKRQDYSIKERAKKILGFIKGQSCQLS